MTAMLLKTVQVTFDGKRSSYIGDQEKEFLTMQIARQKAAELLIAARKSPDWKIQIFHPGRAWSIWNATTNIQISIWE